jgi:hypothetical protein
MVGVSVIRNHSNNNGRYNNVNREVMKIEAEIEVKGLKDAMLKATDPKQMQQLAQKAGELKDKIKDANEQAEIFATGSKYEQVTNAFGAIKGDLENMDFEGAAEKAKLFAAAAKGITFGDAVSGIKNLGVAFATMGKALLTNPIFLIAAVIAGIIYALVQLAQKFGIVQKVMDLIGKAFDGLIYYIQEIVLWFANLSEGAKIALAILFPFVGLINLIASAWAKESIEASRAEEARRKAREAEIKVAQEALISAEKQIDALIKVRKEVTDRYDHELALAQASGKDTARIEEEKLEFVRASLQEELRLRREAAKQAAIILKGDFTEGFNDVFEQQVKTTEDALKKQEQSIEIFEAKRDKAAADKAKERRDKQIKDQQDLDAELARMDEEQRQAQLEREWAQQKEDEELLQRYYAIVAEEARKAQEEQDRIAAEAAEADRIRTEQIEEAKRNAFATTANLMRSISDLLTAAGVENVGLQKTIALAQIAYDTGKAISGAIAQAQSVPFPANLAAIATGVTAVISGIASAIKAVQGAPQVKGASGGGSFSAPTIPNVQPAFNLFGNANQFNNASAARSEEMTVRAYVSETEISGTQSRLNKIRNLSEL